MEHFTSWLKTTYDRLMAVVVLSALILSLLYLALRIGVVHRREKQWESEIVNMVPAFPKAEPVDGAVFDETMVRIRDPHIMDFGSWARRFIVPEERFYCEDCKYPNPMDAVRCASCEKELASDTVPPGFDSDGDGLPDVWEQKFGFDPLDPDDAGLDPDGDGFDNTLEFKNETNPTDKTSTPPIEAWLVLKKMEAEAFNLLFKSHSTMPDGEKVFQLNTKDGGKTHFVKLSGVIDSFTVVDFTTNFVEQIQPVKRMLDKSKLTLKTGDRDILLTMGERVKWDKFNAVIEYIRDGQSFTVHQDEEFLLQGNKYRVISIDTKADTVVISRVSDNKTFNIRKENNPDASSAQDPEGNEPGGEKAQE